LNLHRRGNIKSTVTVTEMEVLGQTSGPPRLDHKINFKTRNCNFIKYFKNIEIIDFMRMGGYMFLKKKLEMPSYRTKMAEKAIIRR